MGDQETYDITQLIRRLHKEQQLTIVLIEHDMRVVFHLADRITVLAEGAVLGEGTPGRDCPRRTCAGRIPGEGRMSVLEASGLHTYYGKSHILHGVSLTVNEGEIVALLGRNGAGKTTTLRTLVGLTPAREGSVTIFGKNVTDLAVLSHRRARCRLRARRPADFRPADRRRESARAARTARALDDSARL